MRIYHIISGDLWAGAEVMVYHLLRGLRVWPELRTSAVLFNDRELAEAIRGLGVEVDVLDENRMSFPEMAVALREIFRHAPPDVVHAHRVKENMLACLASKGRGALKLVTTQHGLPELHGYSRNAKYRLLSRINFLLLKRCFHQVVAVSWDLRKQLLHTYALRDNQVQVIHNGIEISGCPLRRANGGSFTVGSSGRLFPVKDYPLMVQVAKCMAQKVPDVRFELAGDGPDLTKLRKLIEAQELGDIFLLRGFTRNMPAFYRGLDLYISTSTHEGLPMSILEAMSHQLPVVACKVGGIEEVVRDGVEGFLAEGRRPEDLADRCLQLYTNGSLRKQMALAAREKVVQCFSLEKMVHKYFELYTNHTAYGHKPQTPVCPTGAPETSAAFHKGRGRSSKGAFKSILP